MADSITITDNRSGDSVEVPIQDGGVSATDFSKLLPGIWFYDPSFMSTALASSNIGYIDGDAGILRYRGYPIEQLAEQSNYLEVAYLVLNGELPSAAQLEGWKSELAANMDVNENFRTSFFDSFHHDAHPMGVFVSSLAALSPFYPEAKDVEDAEVRHRQVVRLVAQAPTLAAASYRHSLGLPYVHPDPELSFVENFAAMMWKGNEARYEPNPVITKALEVLFILHVEHEQNCGTLAMRTVGSSHADPFIAASAGAAALSGPRHGGANEQVLLMLNEIGSVDNVDAFIADVKGRKRLMEGFGHRVYKNYDPRAKIIKTVADQVFEVTGRNPLLDIALKLEEIALSDEYFISRRLYPNVDFYSGLIYQALGFPTQMFTVLFAIPRTVGWLSHWVELIEQNTKIYRPRQLWTGSDERPYHLLAQRG